MDPLIKARERARDLLESIGREINGTRYGDKTRIQKALKISANKLPRAIERGNIDLITFLGLLEVLGLDGPSLNIAGLEDRDGC